MMQVRAILKRILAISVWIVSGIIAPEVLAQTTIPEPPARSAVDEYGVDLASGNLAVSDGGADIGSADQGGLSFSRQWMGSQGWRHPYFITTSLATGGIKVNVGAKSDTFSYSGGVYTSTKGDGATYTASGGVSTYTSADGTAYTFESALLLHSSKYYGVVIGLGTVITKPDGEKISLKYKTLNWTFCPTSCSTQKVTRLQSVTNNAGYILKFEYASNVISGTSASAPNEWQRITKVTAANGAVDYCDPSADACSFGYASWPYVAYSQTFSGPNKLETVTDSLGRQTRYTINNLGQIVGIKRPGAASNNFTVSYTGDRVSSLNVEQLARTYNWSLSSGILTASINDTLGRSLTVKSNETHKVVTERTDTTGTTKFTIDGLGRVTQVEAPEHNKLQYGYDARGNIQSITRVSKVTGTPANIVESWTYDLTCTNQRTCNKPNSYTDALGRVTNYMYAPTHGGLTSVKLPAPTSGGDRPETRTSYSPMYAWFKNNAGSIVQATTPIYKVTEISACDAGVAPSCVGTANETRTVLGYGPSGVANNLIMQSHMVRSGTGAIAATTQFGLDPKGDIISIDGPLPGSADTSHFFRDLARQLVLTVEPDPDGTGALKSRASKYTYNSDGQVTLSERGTANIDGTGFVALEKVSIEYDLYGRKTKEQLQSSTGVLQSVMQYGYDAADRLICSTIRMNPATWSALPGNACTAAATGSHGPDRITRNSYDASNRITMVETALGTGAAADEVRTAYTANGQIAHVIDAESNRTTYIYDGHDRLSQTRYPVTTKGANSSNVSDYEQLGYDANGNVTSRRLRDGTSIAYTYDNLDRLTAKNRPAGEADVSYTYDLLGRALTATQGSLNYSFAHNALGQMTGQTTHLGTIGYTYDAAGRRLTMSYPGGVLNINYDYDVVGNVTKIRENGATSGVGVLATYAYDNLGRRSSVTFGNGSVQSFGYDPVSRPSTLTNNLGGSATTHDLTQTFTYNPASQIASVTRSNDAYAWQAHYNVDRAYVANGLNRIMNAGGLGFSYDARGNLTSDGTNSYTYSSENLLKTGPGGVSIIYDPLDRLYQMADGTSSSRFQYDGTDMIGEYNASNMVRRRYVHGPGIDNPIVWYEGSAISNTTRRFLMADERGSVVSITDSAGATININAYDEYGIPAPGNIGRFGYTGQAWLPELGMWYYKARIYSPTLGRFMQTDPIGYGDGMNLYGYAGSDPVNFTDSSGRSAAGLLLYFPSGTTYIASIVNSPGFMAEVYDAIVVMAWTSQAFDSAPIIYDHPNGLEWIRYGYDDGTSSDAGVEQTNIKCKGVPHVQAKSTIPPRAKPAFVMHGHQDLTQGASLDSRYPGAGDGFVPARSGITNYMFSSTDLWAIRPDPAAGVGKIDHLRGSTAFKPKIEKMLRENALKALQDKKQGKKPGKPC